MLKIVHVPKNKGTVVMSFKRVSTLIILQIIGSAIAKIYGSSATNDIDSLKNQISAAHSFMLIWGIIMLLVYYSNRRTPRITQPEKEKQP